ncbi:MAG: cytochrome c family protein [Alphaproteobacteria bacterium]|nr:cytochrome c family protein [Alphaproteobacteria bacterium]
MSSFEWNKIFAAVLVAGITAMLSGFIAEKMTEAHELETDAVQIAAAEMGGEKDANAAAAAEAEPITALLAAADIAKGEKLSKACAACHSFKEGEPNKVGPNLWNIVNAKQAHIAGFAYSEGLKNKGGTWTYEELNKFFWKPKAYIPDTKMTYVGIKKPEDRAALIAWLRTLSSNPAPLP